VLTLSWFAGIVTCLSCTERYNHFGCDSKHTVDPAVRNASHVQLASEYFGCGKSCSGADCTPVNPRIASRLPRYPQFGDGRSSCCDVSRGRKSARHVPKSTASYGWSKHLSQRPTSRGSCIVYGAAVQRRTRPIAGRFADWWYAFQ